MNGAKNGWDVVDWIDAAGRLLRNHPFLILTVCLEGTLILAALGWLPSPLDLIMGLPAYAAHSLALMLFGPGTLRVLVCVLALALALDFVLQRVVRGVA